MGPNGARCGREITRPSTAPDTGGAPPRCTHSFRAPLLRASSTPNHSVADWLEPRKIGGRHSKTPAKGSRRKRFRLGESAPRCDASGDHRADQRSATLTRSTSPPLLVIMRSTYSTRARGLPKASRRSSHEYIDGVELVRRNRPHSVSCPRGGATVDYGDATQERPVSLPICAQIRQTAHGTN